jgi:hypothetical protein
MTDYWLNPFSGPAAIAFSTARFNISLLMRGLYPTIRLTSEPSAPKTRVHGMREAGAPPLRNL